MRVGSVAASGDAGSDGLPVVLGAAMELVGTCGMIASRRWWTRIGCDLLAVDAESVEPARRVCSGGCGRCARPHVRCRGAPAAYRVGAVEAMLSGWRSQQTARYLKAKTITSNEVGVRRFQEQVGCWPWECRASHVDEYFEDLLVRPQRLARPTLRAYQLRLKWFSEYACDRRYPWSAICEREFGRGPGQLFDERNLVAHLDEFEGDPRRRPLTVDELEAFFAACEARIEACRMRGRKGSLQAWRDDAMFKAKCSGSEVRRRIRGQAAWTVGWSSRWATRSRSWRVNFHWNGAAICS